MSRKKRELASRIDKRKKKLRKVKNQELFLSLVNFVLPEGALFLEGEFHGNIKWVPEQLAAQALIWSWQDTKKVTDAFEKTLEICEQLGLTEIAKTYTAFMNAISRYRAILNDRLRLRHQELAEETGGRHFRTKQWVLIAFDGSRATAPRSVANEKAFCAPNHGKGNRAKYGKKKSKGLRRKRIKAQKTAAPEPQVWITMMWHIALRLPWTWRLGPSNSCERWHVQEMLEQEKFPKGTLFCGDAGFVGYPLWAAILATGENFLVRVGGNVQLLSNDADILEEGGGIVLCWPKEMRNKCDPIRLRLVQVEVGKTKMWLLTSILDERKLTEAEMIKIYKMRWGIEVEFRGLKQTIDKHKLRCKNSDRLLAELDWSIRAMAIAELIALKQQMPQEKEDRKYDTKDRSLAKTLRALRRCMRNLDKPITPTSGVLYDLAQALVDRYQNTTDKRARFRPRNSDIKPLGNPKVEKITPEIRKQIEKQSARIAA